MKKALIGLVIVIVLGAVYLTQRQEGIPEGESLKVGVIVPLSGPTVAFGELFKSGLDASLEGNQDIQLFYEDSQGTAPGGISAYEKLVNIEGVDVVVSIMSAVSVPLVEKAKEGKFPLIISLVAAQKATSADNPYVYRIFFTADQMEQVMTDLISSDKVENLGILQLENEAAKSMVDYLKPHLEAKGITVNVETFQSSMQDFRTSFTKLQAKNIDALGYAVIAPIQYTNLITQLRESKLDLPIYDIAGTIITPGLTESLGELLEGIRFGTWPVELGTYGQKIATEFQSKYNQRLSGYVGFGYDTGTLLKKLVEEGAKNSTEVLNELSDLESFEGVTSPFHFVDPNNILPDIIPAVVKDGKFVELK